MSDSKPILVTGITGFLGTHITEQLLQKGYAIRAVIRSKRLHEVKNIYKEEMETGKISFTIVDDLDKGDFTEALKGVDVVIHGASPMPGQASAEDAIRINVNGNLNLLKQAEAASVKRYILVSTILTTFDLLTGKGFTADSWNPVTEEQVIKAVDNPFFQYAGHKTLAERAVWDFAERHRNIDVTTINPSLFYGPFSKYYRNPDGNIGALSTNGLILQLITPGAKEPFLNGFTPVVDVARAVVAAANAKSTAEWGRPKRILLAGERFSFKEAVEHIAQVRPELKSRISKAALASANVGGAVVDLKPLEELLGVKITPWKENIIAAVDGLVELTKGWEVEGIQPHGGNAGAA